MIDLYTIKTTEYMDDGGNLVTPATKESVEVWANSRGLKLVSIEHDAQVIQGALYDLSTAIKANFIGVSVLGEIEEFIDDYASALQQKTQENN